MSNKVDERITRIRFDNDQFERGVATSMQSLDRLKNKLESTESVEAFTGIQKAADKTDLSGIAKAVDTISSKFSLLHQTAVRILTGIAEQAIQTGTTLVKSLSVDNMAVGWKKYEDEVTAVQTIMVTLDDAPMEEVEDRLKKIGWYSDETSYSYEEMVGSMSKLISSGVGLDDATNAVIGLANAAAAAGVSTKKAQQAFYNFSQAFGAGYMQLQDWRSIELLNMATPEFKTNILETAAAMKKIVKVGDGIYSTWDDINDESKWFTYKNMRNSLRDKWFDSDVMTEVLGKYGEYTETVYEFLDTQEALENNIDTASEAIKYLDKMGESIDTVSHKAFIAAQEAKTFTEAIDSVKDAVSTKWKDTFKEIFGNYEESRKLWTKFANDLYELFALGGDERNELLALWNNPGYLFEQMIPDERLRNAFSFPEIKKGREVLLEGLWNIYDSVVNVVNVIKAAWRNVFPEMTAFRLYELTRRFKETTAKIKEWTKDLSGVQSFLTGVFKVFKKVIDFWKKESSSFTSQIFPILRKFSSILKVIIPQIRQFFADAFDYFNVGDKVTKGAGKLKRIFMDVRQAILDFDASSIRLPTFEEFLNAIQKLKINIGDIKNYITSAIQWIGQLFKRYVPEDTIQELVVYTDSITESTREFTGLINPELKNTRSNFRITLDVITKFFSKLQGILSKITDFLKKQFKDFDLKDALGTGVIGVLSWFTIKAGKATEGITTLLGSVSKGVGYVLTSVGDIFVGFTRIADAYAKNIKADTITKYITGIAYSILAIVAALYLFTKIDSSDGKLEEAINVIGRIATTVGIICAALGIIETYLNRTAKSTSVTGVSIKGIQVGGTSKKRGILGVIIGVAGLVLSIKMLADLITKGNLTTENIKHLGIIVNNIATTLVGCIIAMQLAMSISSKYGGKFSRTSFLAPVSMAMAMLTMIRVFQKLDNTEIKDTKKVFLGILSILGTLSLFSLALGRVDAGVGIAMLGIAVSILLFMRALEKIQDSNITLEGKGGYIAIFFGLLTVLGLISIFSKKSIIIDKNKQKLKNVSTNMLSIILGLIACVGAIYLLSKLPKDELIRGTAATIALLITLFGMLSVLLLVVSHQGQYAGKGLLGLSVLLGVITIMVAVFTVLARFDSRALSYAVFSVGLIAVAIGAMLTPLIWIKDKVRGIGGVVTAILLMLASVTAFYFFAKNDSKKLQQAVVSIGALALAIGASCWLISHISTNAIIADGHHMLELIFGLLIALTAVTIALSHWVKDADKALTGAEAISLMGIAISVACMILAGFPPVNWDQVITSLTMFGSVAAILGLLFITLSWAVNGDNLSWIKTYGNELLVALLALTALSAAFTVMGKFLDAKAALKGAEIMLIVAGALVLVGVALGAISYGLKKFFESQGVDIMDELQDLIDITYTIGALISALVGGILWGALPNIGQSLSDFTGTVQPFIDFVTLIPPNFGDLLSGFAQGLADFTSASFWYNIADLFDKGSLFENTINDLVKGMTPITKLVNEFGAIPEDSVTRADKVAEFIQKLGPAVTSLNNAEFGKLNDNKKGVYPALSGVAEHIKTFGDSLSVIDGSTISKVEWVTTTLNAIGDAAGAFYNEFGGMYQLSEIGYEIEELGSGVSAFLTNTSNVTQDSVTQTSYVKDMIIELLKMNNSIGKNQGVAAWFQGWTDIGKFGKDLGEFVKDGLATYYVALDSVTVDYLKNCVEKTPYIVDSVAGIAKLGGVIGNNAGLWPNLAGNTNYKKFGEQLSDLADAVILYGNKLLVPTNVNAINAANNVTSNLGDAFEKLTASDIPSKLDQAVEAILNFANNAIDNLKNVFISEETKEKIYSAIAVMISFVKSAADSIAQNTEYISSIFSSLFSSMTTAVSTGISDLASNAETLANEALTGMANSFENGKDKLVEAYGKVQKAVKDKGNEIWKTQSPSKETYKLGNNIIQGNINGILDKKDELVQTYSELNEEVEEQTEETFSDVADNLATTAKDTLSEFAGAVTEENKGIIDNITTFFSNMKQGISNSTSEGMDWIREKFDEFMSERTGTFDGTGWMSLILGTGGNPLLDDTNYFDQLQNEFEQWLSNNGYEMPITPVLTDENGNEITDWQSMLGGSGGTLSGTIAGYTSEDVRNLTAEIYHLEDALYSLKEAMKNQQITHSGELTIRYSNETDFIDRIQTAIIGEIRREVRG